MSDAPELRAAPKISLSLTLRQNGLAWVHIRPLQASGVPISIETLRELEELAVRVEALANEGSVRALVLVTAPPHVHLTGYDPNEVRLLEEEEDIVAWSHEGQRILRTLETLPVPTIAAMRGEWLGPAAELALACTYRIAAQTPRTRIGFPQTRLGFLPAWGGSVRLPRLIGLQDSVRLILSGESLTAREAVEVGLIDRIVGAEDFALRVEEFAERRAGRGRPRRKRGLRRRFIDDTAPGRRLALAWAAQRHARNGDPTLAARVALDLLASTTELSLELAFARESAAAGELIVSDAARGRLHSHRFTDQLRASLPPARGEPGEAAVLGSGQTGSDFAHMLATAGARVRLKDSSRDAVRSGLARTRSRLRWEEEHGLISERQARKRASRTHGATGFGGFGTLDLVVAAEDSSDEDAEAVLAETEHHIRRSCLLAFHHWTASPTRVQRAVSHPERVIGLLPSFPLERFHLMEIAAGTQTGPDAIATARQLATRLSLTSIVVPDQTPSPGTRLLGTYFAESCRLLEEGATVTQIDRTMEMFGFEVGPFKRLDAFGSRRALELLDALTDALGDRFTAGPLLRRFGEQTRTFYRYRSGRPVDANEELPAGLSPGGSKVADLVRQRMMLALLNEAAKIVEDGAVQDPGDLEVIAIVGLGFPREKGGLLFHAETQGAEKLVADLTAAERKYGPRFHPANLLRDLASTGGGFFYSDLPQRLDSASGA